MKRTIISVLLAVFVMFGGVLLSACGQTSSDEDKILIYTSFYPLYDFTQKVGGDKVEVVNLVKAGEEAHHYTPTTKQMMGLEDADLIIINGLGIEDWITGLSNTITQKVVDTSFGVTAIERTTNEDNGVAEEHEHEEHDEHDHGSTDPHIWLSIKNAKIQMQNIKNALIEIDPDNAEYYQDNYDRYAILFDGLDAQFETTLSGFLNKNIVVSHRAFGYLAHDYNLVQYSLSDIETDTEPTFAKMQEIIDFVNDNNIKGVFYQEFTSQAIANQIQAETGAQVYKLSTIEGLSQEHLDMGEDYLSLMAQNLVNLIKALA